MTSERVADRYFVRLAVRKMLATSSFRAKVAAVPDLTPVVLEAFVDAFAVRKNGRVAFLGGLTKKLEKLVALFKRAPQAWEAFKKLIGVDSLLALPKALKRLAATGFAALGKILRRAAHSFPLSLVFVAPNKMPTISYLIKRIIGENSSIERAFKSVQEGAVRVDKWLQTYLPSGLSRIVLAGIYIFLWWNVAELSADWSEAVRGFLGGVSLGDMFNDLPEWGLSFVAGLLGLNFGVLPLILVARLLWLVRHKYLEWVPGKGLQVRWDQITGEKEAAPELVPVF